MKPPDRSRRVARDGSRPARNPRAPQAYDDVSPAPAPVPSTVLSPSAARVLGIVAWVFLVIGFVAVLTTNGGGVLLGGAPLIVAAVIGILARQDPLAKSAAWGVAAVAVYAVAVTA